MKRLARNGARRGLGFCCWAAILCGPLLGGASSGSGTGPTGRASRGTYRSLSTRRAAMSAIDDLVPLLRKLRSSGVLQSLELRLQQAREDSLPYEEFLFRLLSDEVERRDSKQLEQRVRRGNFEHAKT